MMANCHWKNNTITGASAALLLNSLKELGEYIMIYTDFTHHHRAYSGFKIKHMGIETLGYTDEILTALSICAATNPTRGSGAASETSGCEAHSTVILSRLMRIHSTNWVLILLVSPSISLNYITNRNEQIFVIGFKVIPKPGHGFI